MPMTVFETAAQDVISDALKHIETHYGAESSEPKAYHNLEHTGQVMEAAAHISEAALRAGRIATTEVTLIGIAAACHDTVHTGTSGKDEQGSAMYARYSMERFEAFTPAHLDLVEQMILATRAKLEDGIIVQQVPEDNYPAKILADADLAHFGKTYEKYQPRVALLYAEMCDEGRTHGISNFEFMAMQPRLLSYHVFHTAEARYLYPHQRDNMRRMVGIIREQKLLYTRYAAAAKQQAAAYKARNSR